MTVDTIDLPEHWASYLINGDASGLDDGEEAAIDAHLDAAEIVEVIDVGEPFFSWSFGLCGGAAEGGNLAEYTVRMNTEDAA